MPSADDVLHITVTTVVCSAIVMLGVVLALMLARRRSILTRTSIVVVGAAVSVAVSTGAAAYEMFLGSHEVMVVAWISGIAAVVAATSARLVLSGTISRATGRLVDAARRIAEGEPVVAVASGWDEFDRLSTQLADTSARLAAARADVQRLERARARFFAGVSHDLRTPLAGIRALAEAVEDGLAERPMEYVARIRGKVDVLDRMVDDLFESSKLESGTLSVRPEVVTLLDAVSDAVVDVRGAADRRGVVIEHAGIAGLQLWADPRELTRALGNVLSNAVRHAPADSIVLVSAHEDDDGQVVLGVRDAGDGVSPGDLGRLFEVGWRADAARANDHGAGATGAGLGLAIVKGIVEAHGGRVRAVNERDGFRLDLILPAVPPGE
ncbi:HAMP domain-containing sensor histidine kinase [Microbacterium sp. lyk4-40-TSB-66]|uniref:sensor histidine kinase n=1 Tax=Microbacterium sp. lyk4-40-TSB-66 TaxID=3040294 RepID=UPI00254DD6EC|nr:HAMP domain-containing sensor histidine kinase [Microbacterium sp. lyk4-40-TSB-66]